MLSYYQLRNYIISCSLAYRIHNISRYISDVPTHWDLCQLINQIILGGGKKKRKKPHKHIPLNSNAALLPPLLFPYLLCTALQTRVAWHVYVFYRFLLGQGHRSSEKLNPAQRSWPICKACERKRFSMERAQCRNPTSEVIAEIRSIKPEWPLRLPGTMTQRLSLMSTPLWAFST